MKEDLIGIVMEALETLVDDECITLLTSAREVANYLAEYILAQRWEYFDQEDTTDHEDSDDDWDSVTDRS